MGFNAGLTRTSRIRGFHRAHRLSAAMNEVAGKLSVFEAAAAPSYFSSRRTSEPHVVFSFLGGLDKSKARVMFQNREVKKRACLIPQIRFVKTPPYSQVPAGSIHWRV
jgi:hypothetical protein